MNNTIAPTTDITDLRAALNGIRIDVNALLEQRAHLMSTTCAELSAHGIESHVITHRGRTSNPPVGTHVRVVDEYVVYCTSQSRRLWLTERDREIAVGPWWMGSSLLIEKGTYEILLIDGDEYLVAKLPDVDDVERGHRLAVGRLRTLAREDDLRVRVRDRVISLLDPMGTVIHEGTIESAYCFILDIDINTEVEVAR
ncbi:hypothetical protein [uncultured Microbacterium sp.]|uniref:hypothetical protein n=1 Tax=uncultured Microbacterium sp. TaxID=191216 RepID=UPI0025E1FFB8|nr:hypothetical protein [uncultured Microbacterium sp.]